MTILIILYIYEIKIFYLLINNSFLNFPIYLNFKTLIRKIR